MGNHEEWVIEQNHRILDEGYDDEFDDEKEERYIEWMSRLPLYYLTDNQVFCHYALKYAIIYKMCKETRKSQY